MNNHQPGIQADVEAISRISAVASILEVICRTTGMGFSAVARVTEDQWIACAVHDEIKFGLLPGGQLKVETTICNEIRQHLMPVVIDDVAGDENYANHHTPAMYGLQSYISVPVFRKDGSFFGTLCAIDPAPAHVDTPEIRTMFKLYADLISFHLDAIEQLATTEKKLVEERETAEMREQFIAILGHDLRNPVGAVSNVAQLLLRMPLDERVLRLTRIIQDSSFRMKGLIDNMLDFARGRLGDGILLSRNPDENLEEILEQVMLEMRVIWPERVIDAQIDLNVPVDCEGKRVAQLFSNLLSNALTHGSASHPVKVAVKNDAGGFTLSVANSGDPIPPAVMKRLFQPFSRGESQAQGLGLGLYIASEIARAHGGTLRAISTPEETCFAFQLPALYQ